MSSRSVFSVPLPSLTHALPATSSPKHVCMHAVAQSLHRLKISSSNTNSSSKCPSAPRASSSKSTPISTKNKSRSGPPSKRGSSSAHKPPFQDVRYKGFRELQQLVSAHGASARLADLTAVMSRLKGAEWQQPADKAALLDQLWHHLQPQLTRAAPRHCAEAMLTSAKLGHVPEGLLDACIRQFAAKVHAADSRVLSNAIYAAATAPRSSISPDSLQQLQQALLPVFQQQVQSASSQAIANVAYALALLGHDQAAQQLEHLLGAAPVAVWFTGSAQNVSITMWAAGVLGTQLPEQHQTSMLQHLLRPGSDASAQELTTAVYGLTLLQQQLPQQQHQQLAVLLLSRPPDAQALSGFLWSSAKLGLQLPRQVVDGFITQLLQTGTSLASVSISLALWGVATMERVVATSQLLQLLRRLAAAGTAVQPQALSMSLWAAAKMKADVPRRLLDQLYGQFAEVLDSSTEPQAVSNALWAAASMLPQPYLPTALLGEQQLTVAWNQPHRRRQQEQQQQGQQGQQEQQHEQALAVVVSKVPQMKLLELANVALALAMLEVKQLDILRPVYDAAVLRASGPGSSGSTGGSSSSSGTNGGSSSSGSRSHLVSTSSGNSISNDSSSSGSSSGGGSSGSSQALSNLCWAGAVLDVWELQPQLRVLAQACAAAWAPGTAQPTAEQAVQLYQLHLWLTELVGTHGLEGVMTPQQLAMCRRGMQSVAGAARPSHWQQQVFEAALQLQPEVLVGVELEGVSTDGLLSIDIKADAVVAAAPAYGIDRQQQPRLTRLLAIEVDGPWHFRRPDRAVVGPTRFKNRLLARQGYLVVSIPYFQWPVGAQQQQQQVAYLRAAVQQALRQQ